MGKGSYQCRCEILELILTSATEKGPRSKIGLWSMGQECEWPSKMRKDIHALKLMSGTSEAG